MSKKIEGIFTVSNPKTREILATSDSVGSAKNAARKRSLTSPLMVRVEGMNRWYLYENGRCVGAGLVEIDEGEDHATR
jgi:hypothetical protein